VTINQETASEVRAVESLATLPDLLAGWARSLGEQRAFTFLDYGADGDGVGESLSWRELDQWVDAVAAMLLDRVDAGQRVAILAGQGLEYVVSFLGALRAGVIAVPLFAPGLPGHAGRLRTVLADCRPALVLTTRAELDPVCRFVGPYQAVVAIEDIPTGASPRRPALDPSSVAYLQYTSGSTRAPAGVMVTHANVVANARQSVAAYDVANRTTAVSWLPLFHDMGLVLSIAGPVALGVRSVLMDPIAFIQRPERWLRALAANPGAVSAAPNFAYSYCARQVSAEVKATLRLDRVHALINGSEPVQPAAIERFQAAFGSCGLAADVHRSSYGLAEATVLVSVTPGGAPSRHTAFAREQLAAGVAVPVAPDSEGASVLVSCGCPAGQQVRIVDAQTGLPKPDGHVGEVWISGPNVALGYWGRPAETEHTFGATVAGEPDGQWLRTGDLGLRHDGELYVTGRLKDLVIVDGRNHYPQDLELTVEEAHPAIRPHNVAAFAVPGSDDGDGERLVVVAERSSRVPATQVDAAELTAAVRAALAGEHGIALSELVLLNAGGVSRTSSGKVSRAACRKRYLDGELA
jgi:acyl-CoA synthetase (AMP-forming)/AMP-acid ligase II